MATSTIAGHIHELGVKLEPPSEVEIKTSENVNSSFENRNDNGRLRLAAATSAANVGPSGDTTANNIGDSSSGSPLFNLSVESCSEYKSKTDKIREAVEQVTSDDSKKKITKLLAEVQQLSDLEKLLLYLRLPSGSKVEVDPLKQSVVSSLGNRYEVTQTVTWIQTHLEEDSEVSLPKQDVYKDYTNYCEREAMKPLSTADFGKVMKQVFPNVRPRRLGTRGNSRYCYAGLRTKVWLDPPRLPDLSSPHEEPSEETDYEDQELNGAVSSLIREWAEKVLERKFGNLRELAFYVVEKGYVTSNSVATFTMLSCASTTGINGKGSQQSNPVLNLCDGSKHREARIQLQRKLYERESIREQKKRLVDQKCQSDKTSHSAGTSTTSSSVTSSKASPRKTPNSKSQTQETLRRLLSTESTGGEPKKKHSEESSWSVGDSDSIIPKLETNTELSCSEKPGASSETTSKLSPVYKRQNSSASKSSTDGQQCGSRFEPVRRKSGGDSRSPRPSPLLSGWSTPTSDITSSVPTCSKSGKVMIPRVTTRSSSSNGASNGSANNHGSKLCLASTNIIIFPPISTSVTIPTEFNNGGARSTCVTPTATTPNGNGSNGTACQKSKYKLIQPKPCSSSDEKNGSDNGKETGGDKEVEQESRSRRGSSSSLKRGSDEREDRDNVNKTPKSRKRSRQPSESDKQRVKRQCIQSQMPPKANAEDGKNAPKCLEDPNNDISQGEIIKNLEHDALIEYLTNSVDHEDELDRYFRNGDEEANPTEIKTENCEAEIDMEQPNEVDISQLRQILEENLKSNLLNISYSANDEQESVGRRETSSMSWNSSVGVNYNDKSSVLRSLLGEQRPMSSADGQNGMRNNESMVKNMSSGGLNNSHIMDACASTSSWRQNDTGDLYLASAAKTSDEMLLSSDSSSGCFSHMTGGAFMPLEEGIFERTHDHSINQHQHLESGNQLTSEVIYGGNVLSYSQLGINHGNSSVPPSPNTRRRAFNFQPISPQSTPVQETHSRTQSPLPYLMPGGTMLSSMRVNSGAGSFVSPSSTPGSLSRSRHNSGQAINTGSSSSTVGTPRATPHHVNADQPSCLHTSFVSPHPTPVPFPRSRHNSSQQSQQQQRFGNSSSVPCTPTTSRSRHSSELMSSTSASGSAPVSPLEAQQPSHSSVAHYSDTVDSHYSNNNRSRHNSSSSYASLPPPQLPHTLLNVSLASSSPLVAPPLSHHLKVASSASESVNLIRNWPVSDLQITEWSNRQMDPRLLSRHRHASVDSHFVPFPSNCPAPLSSTHQELNMQSVMDSTPQQDISQQTIRKVEPSDLQMVQPGLANRSRSVPIYQMLQTPIQPAEALDQPLRDVMMSHSYPATPTGQSTSFSFGGSNVTDCQSGVSVEGPGEDGNDLELELNDYQTIDDADKKLVEVERRLKSERFQQHRENQSAASSVNDGNSLSATLDLPMDQYQNIIPPCTIDDLILSEFPAVDLGLEPCYSAASAASTQH